METNNFYTAEQILNSNQYVNPKTKQTFKTPLEYMNELNPLFGNDIQLQGSRETLQGINDEEQIAFGRVAFTKEYELTEDESYKIGFVYSYDHGKPFIKVFSGVNVHACTNLCVFNSDNITKIDIYSQGYEIATEAVKRYLKNKEQEIINAKKIIKAMKMTVLSEEEMNLCFGKILRNFSALKNVAGTTCILDAMKYLTDKNNRYFVAPDKKTNAWHLYNALTDGYREKVHIIDQPEKVLSLYKEILSCSNYLGKSINQHIENIDKEQLLIA